MGKSYSSRNADTMPLHNDRNLLGLFVSCGCVVFPAVLALVVIIQFAIQQPKVVLAIIGIN